MDLTYLTNFSKRTHKREDIKIPYTIKNLRPWMMVTIQNEFPKLTWSFILMGIVRTL